MIIICTVFLSNTESAESVNVIEKSYECFMLILSIVNVWQIIATLNFKLALRNKCNTFYLCGKIKLTIFSIKYSIKI